MKIKCNGCESNLSVHDIRNQLPTKVVVSNKMKNALNAKGSDEFKKLMTSLEMKCNGCLNRVYSRW